MTNRQARRRQARQAEPSRVQPQLQFSIPCNGIQHHPQGGGFVIVSPFDTINRAGDTPQPFSFVILNAWTSGFGHFSEYMTMIDPEGDVVFQTPESQFWLPNAHHRHMVQHNITVALIRPGQHVIRTYLDNRQVLEYQIRFNVLAQAQAT